MAEQMLMGGARVVSPEEKVDEALEHLDKYPSRGSHTYPASKSDVDHAAEMIKHLANAGVLDRTFQIKVGNVEVNLGPADLPSSIASMSDADPHKRIMLQLLGRGRNLGEVG